MIPPAVMHPNQDDSVQADGAAVNAQMMSCIDRLDFPALL
jgi:hypothetical protein